MPLKNPKFRLLRNLLNTNFNPKHTLRLPLPLCLNRRLTHYHHEPRINNNNLWRKRKQYSHKFLHTLQVNIPIELLFHPHPHPHCNSSSDSNHTSSISGSKDTLSIHLSFLLYLNLHSITNVIFILMCNLTRNSEQPHHHFHGPHTSHNLNEFTKLCDNRSLTHRSISVNPQHR
jgi:hypothetical protein